MNDKVYAAKGKGTQVLEILEGAEAYNNWLAEKIRPFLGKKNAEVGAGQGTISEIIIRDHKVLLSDLAAYNVAFLKKKFKQSKNLIDVRRDVFKKNNGLFNCIYSSNVLEHIEDDIEFIDKCLERLTKKGNFVAVVPAMRLIYSDFDLSIGHFRRYDNEDRERINNWLKTNHPKSNLISYRYFNVIGFFGWLVKMKLMNKTQFGKYDIPLFQFLLPFNKLLDKLNLPFGQSVLLVIQKG